jgi:hypothetical protein
MARSAPRTTRRGERPRRRRGLTVTIPIFPMVTWPLCRVACPLLRTSGGFAA